MKFLVLLFSLFLVGVNTNAQTLNVVSTSPANGDFGVTTDSVVINFDKPIYFNSENFEDPGIFFILLPEDSVEHNGIRVTDDSLSIVFYFSLSANTDFTAILTEAEGVNDEYLEEPVLFQFSTKPDIGQYTVEGTLTSEELAKTVSEDEEDPILVYLASEPIDLFSNDEDCFDEECEEEDDVEPQYAAFANPETGEYSITGVREGTYFPIAIELNFEEEEESGEFYFPKVFFYDPDENFIPDSIDVNSTSAPNDTLSGINLRKVEIVPITFSTALEVAQPILDALENDPIILGGITNYASVDFSETEDSSDFEPKIMPTMFQNTLNSLHEDEDEEGEFLDFLTYPSGFHINWVVIGYDAVKDSAFTIITSPFGAEFTEYIGEEDADLPEGISFSSIKTLPETFIDSDSAAYIINEEGGNEFIEFFEENLGLWTMELEALHGYWDYENNPTPEAPVMWRAEFSGVGFDFESDRFINASLVIFLDIETGEVLFSEYDDNGFGESSHITFDEAVDLVESLLSELPNDPEIVGGITRYNNYDIVVDDEFSKKSNAFISKMKSEMEDSSFTINPDGHAFSWEIFAYDEVKDSALTFYVTSFEVEFGGYLSENEIDNDIEFDSLMTLPFTHIGSDSAAYLIDLHGGYDFRSELEDSDLDWNWELELQLLHNYWDFSPNPTPGAPITWTAEFYAWAINDDTFESYSDSLTIILDAETGAVLFSTVIVSNENEIQIPEEFSLMQNYPNPFNPSTNIPFELSTASNVEISVYTILGQEVATLTNDLYSAGQHSISWNAQGFSSGVYIYRMRASGFTQTKKLLLLK